MFTSDEFEEFATGMGIKLLNSSPYYAQTNGQAEASNKGVIKLIKKKIDEYPRSGILCFMKLYGHTEWLVMALQRCLHIIWYTDMKLFSHGS